MELPGRRRKPTRFANAMLVADDALGGFFAISVGAFAGKLGNVFYLPPDCLTWEDAGRGYTTFLEFLFEGDLATFYEGQRWASWREDCAKMSGDRAWSIYPFLWAREGGTIDQRARMGEFGHRSGSRGARAGERGASRASARSRVYKWRSGDAFPAVAEQSEAVAREDGDVGASGWGGARGRRRGARIGSTSSGAEITDRMESRPPHRPQTRRSTSNVRCSKELQSSLEVAP